MDRWPCRKGEGDVEDLRGLVGEIRLQTEEQDDDEENRALREWKWRARSS
jgi:hypothetical protein